MSLISSGVQGGRAAICMSVAMYFEMLEENGLKALVMTHNIMTHDVRTCYNELLED